MPSEEETALPGGDIYDDDEQHTADPQLRKIEQVIASIPSEARQIDAIAHIRGWFRPEDDSEFYPIIEAYLDGEISLSEAEKQITGPIDELIRADQTNRIDSLDLWYSYIHSAKRIPFRDTEGHEKLLALVKAVKEHPAPSEEHNDYYRDQGGLGLRESWNDSPGCGAGYSVPELHAWASSNYFTALLTRSGVYPCWMYAIWAMREALEEEHKNVRPEGGHQPGTGAQKLDANVPAAATWVLALGKALYDHEEDLTPADKRSGDPAKGGKFWRGKSEFSKARWALWKKRFGEIAEQEGLREETVVVAREAVSKMEEAERT